jgi:tetratricopeptide (TPR) repeat protein
MSGGDAEGGGPAASGESRGAAPGPAGAPAGGVPNGNGSGAMSNTPPGGEVYDWYTRGVALLHRGNANAAAQLLAHAAAAEPAARSVREALARAQFDAGEYSAARESFAWIVARDPADDYAQYGLGLAARKVGDLHSAVEHLALAAAMRPDLRHYGQALRGARAALNRS